MLKYLRIAVTALSLTACVLLVALWMRSYYYNETLSRMDTSLALTTLRSAFGTISFSYEYHPRIAVAPQSWWLDRYDATEKNFPDFWYVNTKQAIYIRCPNWLPIILLGTLAMLPWARRFSLRSLLFATTAVAAALGLVFYVYRT